MRSWRDSVDDRIVLRRNVSWPDLEQFLAAKDDAVVPRIHYLDGTLELVTPSRGHERHGAWISALVTTYALERGIELSSYRSWLLKDELRKAGAEPDDCFIRGDDSADPLDRPHFAIEVQWSRRGVNKLEVYRRLRVPEVWFWERGTIAIYVRKRNGFVRAKCSAALPDLDVAQLASFLDRPTTTTAIREYRAVLLNRG
jgi:Uma2 family endonuclease